MLKLTHPDKLLWREDGISKHALAEYYVSIAPHVVPHVRGRPLTLVRATDAIEDGTMFLKHGKQWGPKTLRRIHIPEKTKVGEYLVADDIEGVLGLVQMSIVEIHTWNSVAPDIEHPDRMVLDLDPDEELAFTEVIAAARLLRDRLRAVGLASLVKTTGGKGLHVVVPLVPRADWEEVFAWSRAFAEGIVRQAPRHFTAKVGKQHRRGKILIDYLRNNRGNTSVAAFSPRARPGAPVSMPISWEELGRVDPMRYTIRSVPRLLARRRRDPWHAWEELRRPLTVARAARR